MRNAEIATALDELGDLYELDGAVVYRVVAYRQAARSIRDSSRSVAQLAAEGRATELPHVGKTLEEKIQALLEGLADVGQLSRPALGGELCDRSGRVSDRAGRLTVGDDPVDDGAIQLVEVAELVE